MLKAIFDFFKKAKPEKPAEVVQVEEKTVLKDDVKVAVSKAKPKPASKKKKAV